MQRVDIGPIFLQCFMVWWGRRSALTIHTFDSSDGRLLVYHSDRQALFTARFRRAG